MRPLAAAEPSSDARQRRGKRSGSAPPKLLLACAVLLGRIRGSEPLSNMHAARRRAGCCSDADGAAAKLEQAERIERLTLGEEKVAIAENLTDVEKAERVPRQAGTVASRSRPSVRASTHTRTLSRLPFKRVGVLHTSTHDSGA